MALSPVAQLLFATVVGGLLLAFYVYLAMGVVVLVYRYCHWVGLLLDPLLAASPGPLNTRAIIRRRFSHSGQVFLLQLN